MKHFIKHVTKYCIMNVRRKKIHLQAGPNVAQK